MNENSNDNQGKETSEQLTPHTVTSRAGETLDDITSTLRDLFNRVPETVNKAVERAMNVRDTTVIVRLSESSSDSIDTLVSAGIFKSRTDAAAFLIDEGIKAQSTLYQGIQEKLGEIEKLREELRNSVAK
ncbi:MAG: hypothetical protein ACKVZH_26180 [Blastocatellia bacterium]